MRLAFSVAVHLQPDVLLLDEILAVGDLTFQRKCLHHVMRYLEAGGSVVFVGHSLHHVQAICQRGILLEHGAAHIRGIGHRDTQSISRGASAGGEAIGHGRDPCRHRRARTPARERRRGRARTRAGGGDRGACPAARRSRADAAHAGGTVVIDELAVGPVSGDVLWFGDDAVVTMRYRAATRMENMSWSFAVFTGDQWVCVGAALCPPFTIHAGTGEVSARVRAPVPGHLRRQGQHRGTRVAADGGTGRLGGCAFDILRRRARRARARRDGSIDPIVALDVTWNPPSHGPIPHSGDDPLSAKDDETPIQRRLAASAV